MENNITVNMENLSEEEREQLMKLIQKSNKTKRKIWEPEYDEWYFSISGCGEVESFNWLNDSTDDSSYGIGNCFKTREDAEFALEKLKVEAELRRFAEENNECGIDWKNKNQEKWYIFYNYNDNKSIWFGSVCNHKMNIIYFSSKEIAKQAVEYIGEERLKKYYFEVED